MFHGFIPPERFFPYLTWTDIAQMPNRENVIIVQPVGAIEQHGPHLPLAVDAVLGTGVLGMALQQLEPEVPVYVLPPLCYGKSNEHWHFPGTVTLTAATLLAVLKEVATSIYRAGFRKLILFNSHGGQPQVLEIAARDLHQEYADFCVFPFFAWRVPTVARELFSDRELEYGIHAGDIETSAMLSLLPEQVRMAQAVCEWPPSQPPDSWLSMEGKLPFAWTTRDLSASGVLGDATAATREKGDRLLQSAAASWVQVFREVYHFCQPQANPPA
ncbi:MAG: creatininase family protein [Spirulinaceae cyanobacterium SM2_1_0]|nr:creatininase family protein [Spirulinaceae cyanobacterium SM2_1_0]